MVNRAATPDWDVGRAGAWRFDPWCHEKERAGTGNVGQEGKGTTVRKAVCAPDGGGQPPTPAADPFSFGIKRFAWEEDEAARRKDWSAARGAALKKVILQEARVLARGFV